MLFRAGHRPEPRKALRGSENSLEWLGSRLARNQRTRMNSGLFAEVETFRTVIRAPLITSARVA